ncbi:hypothetical protein OQA88_7134 [Cercophora sp. LCS_1]
MASFVSGSDSDSDYGYDLTLEEEQELIALIDRISPPTLAPSSTPALAPAPTPAPAPVPVTRRRAPSSVSAISSRSAVSSLDSYLKEAVAVHEVVENIDENDLNFDITELKPETAYNHGSGSDVGVAGARGEPTPVQRHFAPSVASDNRSLRSYVSRTKPRAVSSLLADSHVLYPDLSRALSDARKSGSASSASEVSGVSADDSLPPIIRWRSSPNRPLSVSDLTAGSWCELQHYFTLSKRGGKKTRTPAMKAGTTIHERLESEVYETVQIDISKREDTFGLRLWNIIEGLRALRDTGLTRELEVWGIVDGKVVNGIVDGLSYENPDPELEEDVISSRGSQSSQSSQHQLSLGNKTIFVTDVKTRASKTPPSQAQVRAAIIQLFLYHRFISAMASDRLDYIKVFERYGVNPDETFSDRFMAQIASLHEEVFSDADSDTTTESTADYVTAVSSPSQIGDRYDDVAFMKYRTLRSLLPLLRFEMQLTFPRGAATLGQIVAVEYRLRAKTPEDPENGGIICTNSFYVEQDKLDIYLEDNMQWWRGEREARGVALEEGFKCRFCEFVDDCEWRMALEREAHRKAKLESAEREAGGRKSSLQW